MAQASESFLASPCSIVTRAWRESLRTTTRPFNLTPPFPFLKGPLMVFDAPLVRHLLSGACGFPHSYPSPMPSHFNGKGRGLHDVAIGWYLSSCPPIGGVTLFDIGVANPTWRSMKGSAAPTGGGFLELRPRVNLRTGVAACLRGVHFGSGPVSTKRGLVFFMPAVIIQPCAMSRRSGPASASGPSSTC